MIIVGSRAFFEGIEGFSPKDIDILELVDNPTGFKDVRQLKGKGKCVFQWRNMPSDEFIDVTLKRGLPMEIGKFLVPEFATTIGLTIEELKRLQPLVDSLDYAHHYEKLIYEAYLSNNAFALSDAQRKTAYAEYINCRIINKDMDWNNMNYGVPERFGEPCVIRTHKGDYRVATFELVGQMGGWVTSDARIVDIFHVSHWAYITPPNV